MDRRQFTKSALAIALSSLASGHASSRNLRGMPSAGLPFNLIGMNIDAGGYASLGAVMVPVFTNLVWQHGAIKANASFNTPCTFDSNGWPTEDFEIGLWSTGANICPAWAYSAATPTWFCGFIPRGGTPVIAAGNTYGQCTISNVQTGQGPGAAYTTFNLTVNNNGTIGTSTNPGWGFKVTGTGGAGVTDLFAYIPAYASAGANTSTGYFQPVPTCTAEWIAAHSSSLRLRFMDMQNAWNDCGYLLPFANNGTFTASVSTSGVMTVSAMISGFVSIGAFVIEFNLPSTAIVSSQLTGTANGVGTYQLSYSPASAIGSNTFISQGAAVGATSAVLAAGFPQATATYPCVMQSNASSSMDARNIAITTSGQTAISWAGGLAYPTAGMLIPNSGATRRTMSNWKMTTGGISGQAWSSGINGEGYPFELCMTMAIAANVPEVHVHLPLNDDASVSYAQSLLTAAYAYSNGTGGPNGNQTFGGVFVIEFNNELWNQTGAAGAAAAAKANLLNSSFPNTYVGTYQYLGVMMNAVANMIRTNISSSWFNTKVRMCLATQGGGNGVTLAAYTMGWYASQGLTPSNDMKNLAWSVYIETAGLTSANSGYSIAQIQTAVSANINALIPTYGCNRLCQYALAYGLQPIAYEIGHDTNIYAEESIALTNLAAAMNDPGMVSINANFIQTYLDQGFGINGITWFKDGVFQNSGGTVYNDGLSNTYPLGNTPRWAALQSFMANYAPQFNVVSGAGSVIQGYNYRDNYPNTNLVTLGTNTGSYLRSGNWYSGIFVINCTAPGTYPLTAYVTTTASSLGLFVDYNQTAGSTGYPVASGLSNGSIGVPISMGNVTLNLGKNYIAIGSGSLLSGISINSLTI